MEMLREFWYGKYRKWLLLLLVIFAVAVGAVLTVYMGDKKTTYKLSEGKTLAQEQMRELGFSFAEDSEEYYYYAERGAAGLYAREEYLMAEDLSVLHREDAKGTYLRTWYWTHSYMLFKEPEMKDWDMQPYWDQSYHTLSSACYEQQPIKWYTAKSDHTYFRQELCQEAARLGYEGQRQFYREQVLNLPFETLENRALEALKEAQIELPDDGQGMWEQYTLDRAQVYVLADLTVAQRLEILEWARVCYTVLRAQQLGIDCPDMEQLRGLACEQVEEQLAPAIEQINATESQKQINAGYENAYAHLGIWPAELMNK